ncbi:MAG: hypothetical protein Q4E37_05315 [Tissierellia bacterium]|nr:hypothetical protein [Tissierellia bacterium]
MDPKLSPMRALLTLISLAILIFGMATGNKHLLAGGAILLVALDLAQKDPPNTWDQ